LETPVERAGLIGVHAARRNLLLPPAALRANGRREIGRRLLVLQQTFERGADRFAGGDALGSGGVVPRRVAREESIPRPAEAVPDRFGFAFLHRPDGAPLGLEFLDLGGGLIPVGRFRERFGTDAERVLSGQILRPHDLTLGEVLVPAGEEVIAGRAEPIP